MAPEIRQRAATGFGEFLPDLDTPRFQVAKKQNAYEYANAFKTRQHPPWLYDLTRAWERLLQGPYRGVTTDGPNTFAALDSIYTDSH